MDQTRRSYLLVAGFVVTALSILPSMAQDTSSCPIMTIHTHRYETSGGTEEAAQIQFSLTSTEATPVKVDFGDGYISTFTVTPEAEIGENEQDDTLTGGTTISGTVGPSGIVRVWGDASKFDYLDLHGSEVYQLDIEQLTQLEILSLSHNQIERLDLSMMDRLQYIDVADNTFEHGFTLGDNHPNLLLLNINQLGYGALTSGTISLETFPYLDQFSAWDTKCLRTLDTSHNERLRRISVDNSGMTHIDVSNNPMLQVLNVSDCGFTELDVTHNPHLVQLYVANESRSESNEKLSHLDLSQNPYLECLFLDGNAFTTLDLRQNPEMQVLHMANNCLEHLDITMLHKLIDLDLSGNCFDFVSLPEPSSHCAGNLYYYYDLQQPWPIATEFGVGQTLDLTKRALRTDTETMGYLFSQNIDGISDPVQLNEGEDYTYADGCFTFLKPQADPVYAYLHNSKYQDCNMTTTQFMVRPAEDYGKPVTLFSFTPALATGQSFDYTYTLNGELIQEHGTYDGQTYDVQGTIGSRITSLDMAGVQLTELNLAELYNLEELNLDGCSLPQIDLSWNRRLKHINLDNNGLTRLDLTGVNNAYNKNVLTQVRAGHNALQEFCPGVVPVTIETLWLDNNQLKEIDLRDMSRLHDLDLSNNQISQLSLADCSSLDQLIVNHNLLTTLDVTPCEQLSILEARFNRMRYSTLPEHNGSLAPQLPITIATKAQVVDLSSEAEVRGCATTYIWRDAKTGETLSEGTDYTLSEGKTKFLPSAKGRTVYCQLTNEAFPAFINDDILCTTTTLVDSEPTYVAAAFTTPVGGQTASLSLAAAEPNTFIYIDWGNGELEEYALQTTYQLFSGTTVKNGKVRVMSNTLADGGITVFSISNVTMSTIDVSAMERLYCLTLDNAGLTTIDLSHNTDLHELSLGGNEFATLDLSHNERLGLLYLSDNHFTTLDVTGLKNLYWLQAGNNAMTEIDVTGLSNLEALDLTHNMLTEIDVTTCSSLWQLFVAENQLHNIDLSHNHSLNVVNLNNNFFDFTTLPLPEWNVYYYANQAPLAVECVDGKVNLSAQHNVCGNLSDYYWFVGEIEYYYDENGKLTLANEELVEGEDFMVNEGIITFAQQWPKLTGLVVNATFPDILLFTQPLAVTASSLESIEADVIIERSYYMLDGRRVYAKPQSGCFIQVSSKINKRQ